MPVVSTVNVSTARTIANDPTFFRFQSQLFVFRVDDGLRPFQISICPLCPILHPDASCFSVMNHTEQDPIIIHRECYSSWIGSGSYSDVCWYWPGLDKGSYAASIIHCRSQTSHRPCHQKVGRRQFEATGVPYISFLYIFITISAAGL